jgi:hypothetical protein
LSQPCGASSTFVIVEETDEHIIIRDLCGQPGYESWMSVTNGAENVVRHLIKEHHCAGKRIYYYDTDGRLDQLKHNGRAFTDFGDGPGPWRED